MPVTTMNLLFALLTLVAVTAVIAFLVLAIGARIAPSIAGARDAVWDGASEVAIPLAAAVAWTCMLGSLYYSEIANFIPCRLCWYQRIAMYPLAVILLVAAIRRDHAIRAYVLPLVAIGAVISTYHYQLERFPSQHGLACTIDAPCTVVWVWMFHFISLPFMALSGFALIASLVWIAGQRREPAQSFSQRADAGRRARTRASRSPAS